MVTQTNKTQMNDEHNHAVGPTKFPPHPEKIYIHLVIKTTLYFISSYHNSSHVYL